jgi:TolB protein
VSNAQGRQVARRTRTAAVEASPCFSPDGSQLIYTSDAAGGPQLYIMPAAGGSSRRLATNISGYCAEPDWSRGNPDLIAFTVRVGRGYRGRGARPERSHADSCGVQGSGRRHRAGVARGWAPPRLHAAVPERAASCSSSDTETGRSTAISAAPGVQSVLSQRARTPTSGRLSAPPASVPCRPASR